MPNSNITEVYSKIKFQSIDEKKFLPRVLWSVAFLCLQQVSIWFSIVRICPLKRWSCFVFTFCIAFEAMWWFKSIQTEIASFLDSPCFRQVESCGSSNLSKMPLHLWLCNCFSLVGATCGRPRAFTERPYGCGGSNLSTDLLLWGIYIKKCISLVRICLQTRNARNASTKFRKTSESKSF